MKSIGFLFVFLISFFSCDLLFEKATPVTWGMVDGKVIEWRGSECYMIDLGSIYIPEKETAIFIVGVGPNHEERREWVVESDMKSSEFIRGIGPEPFQEWPNEVVLKTIALVKETKSRKKSIEHPLEGLTQEERTQFVYSQEFNPTMFLMAVKYWAGK